MVITTSSSRLGVDAADLPTAPPYTLEPGRPTPGWPALLRPPVGNNGGRVVQEY